MQAALDFLRDAIHVFLVIAGILAVSAAVGLWFVQRQQRRLR